MGGHGARRARTDVGGRRASSSKHPLFFELSVARVLTHVNPRLWAHAIAPLERGLALGDEIFTDPTGDGLLGCVAELAVFSIEDAVGRDRDDFDQAGARRRAHRAGLPARQGDRPGLLE